MRDMNELKNAYGEADTGFRRSVYLTLANLKKSGERTPMKKMNFRIIAAAAAVVLLAAGTAVALTNPWGILDFLGEWNREAVVLPDAAEIVQTDMPQNGGETELVSFSVREAVYDGENLYVVVEARSVGADKLILGSDTMLTDPIGDLGPLFANRSGTIAEYLKESGRTPIHTSMLMDGVDMQTSSFLLESDGVMVYMLSSRYDDGAPQLTLDILCVSTPFVDGGRDVEAMERRTLTVTLQNTGTQNMVSSVNAIEYADCGVRVDKITLTSSPMAIYTEIEFTVIDPVKYAETEDGLWFEFIDAEGNRLPDGADASGHVGPADETGTRFIQKGSLRAAPVLPGEVSLRGYNAWEKNRYEAHTFEMK